MSDPDLWPRILTTLAQRDPLSTAEAAAAMHAVFAGEATPGQIGAFPLALRTKGETVDEVQGFAETMLGFATPVRSPAFSRMSFCSDVRNPGAVTETL